MQATIFILTIEQQLADIISGVCHVMPSATYEEILWKLSFAAVAHLIAASYRAIGKHTARPFDIKAALAALEHRTVTSSPQTSEYGGENLQPTSTENPQAEWTQ